ncbi:hypothetical protein [Costertonia aggregata]|uniref:Uncharacterized protein n=1 Tax=Costertonia aggregata TaxID=343403 RepID=A0A7H9ATT5_9FLAO|nr:hypothetical protein [Costertonia aggregata]QLG46859.1 hypothetical protein HYG79_16365 [Costertonia aggregata]
MAFGLGDSTAQYIGNGFDYQKVDPYKAMVSGVFKVNPSSIFLRSAINSKNQNSYIPLLSSFEETTVDFTTGMMGYGINKNIGSFGLSEFNKSIGGFLEKTMNLGVNSSKTAISVEIKKEVE